MKVSVLRIGHRLVRDDRVTTHAALVARAFGADRIYMTGIDQSVNSTIASVAERWGEQNFEVEVISDWKGFARNWKKEGGRIAHLTMYGINIDDAVEQLRKENKLLVIIGAEKVPREAYELADYNIAVGSQPHSEIAALAIFLDRMFKGKQLKKDFAGGKLRIIPTEKGKRIQENTNRNK
jgi:tRNA (cytidine56-2'-O)-methyltransferase